MLTIRCGGEPLELDVEATPEEFARLAVSIAELAGSETTEVFIEAAAADPGPYDRCLSGLLISKADGPLSVSVVGATLSISGDTPALTLFGECLPVESGLPPGYHIHFEAAGREESVASNSIPLVLSVAGGSDA